MDGRKDERTVNGIGTNTQALFGVADERRGMKSVEEYPSTLPIQRSCVASLALASTGSAEIEYRLACSRSDFLGAFELLQTRYRDTGLTEAFAGDENACRIRMMPYHRWQQSQVFVAAIGERIIGTVTLISAGRFPLPIADYYRREIEASCVGGKVGEITSLAVDPLHTKPTEVFGELTRLLTFFARYQGDQSLAAIVHPRHAKFYQHAMGFQVIGDEVRCHQVCGKPGVAILGSVNDRSRYRKRWQSYYFDGGIPRKNIQPRPISEAEYWYCNSLVEQANLHPKIGGRVAA